jgi:hypothetical protein
MVRPLIDISARAAYREGRNRQGYRHRMEAVGDIVYTRRSENQNR